MEGGRFVVTNNSHKICNALAEMFELNDRLRQEKFRDRDETRWWNHIRQARRSLGAKDLLSSVQRGYWELTDAGFATLNDYLQKHIVDLTACNIRDPAVLRTFEDQFIRVIRDEFADFDGGDGYL
jgi:restriction endonuclease Mrr